MKTIPPQDPTPATGRLYWRGLDELAETPEFKQFLEREFPQGASELTDPVSRRHFVKIMSASFALAGIGLGSAGCRKPEDRLMPFGKAEENFVHGTSQYFATAMPTRTGAVPLVAKSYEGRPVKLEGNPLYPGSNGGTDRYVQASILNLYDPDRAQGITKAGAIVKPEEGFAFLDSLAKKFAANEGEGLCVIAERRISPSRLRLQQTIVKKYPKAKWFLHEAIDFDVHRRAATQAFGKPVRPVFHFDKAKAILSLDCDFIGAEEDAHNNIRRFSAGRKVEKPGDSMNRLYTVESLFTLTGANSDHRLRVPASSVAQVAAAIAAELGVQVGGVAKLTGNDAKWASECAKDLKANGANALVVAGYRQPLAVHLIAHAINAQLGSVGKTVELFEMNATPNVGDLTDLTKVLNGGGVDTLVMFAVNPVYDAPADLNWAAAQKKAKTVVRLGYYNDETGVSANWHFPLAHYLEAWGDALTTDGLLVPIQPLIAPLFGGLTEYEVLARLGGLPETSPHKIVRETFAGLSGDNGDGAWNKFLHDGFYGTPSKAVSASLSGASIAQAIAGLKVSAPSKASLEVVLHRDSKMDDGRYANNGWMQELPDPMTKMVWDNAVLVSRVTAKELGVVNGDIVDIKLSNATVKGAIWTQPGMADYSLGLALGYGRGPIGRIGGNVGFNAYPFLTTQNGYIATGATIEKKGAGYEFACTQTHWSMEGRSIIREANLEQFNKDDKLVKKMDAPEAPSEDPAYPNPLDVAKKAGHHQWGMAIDLNQCVGCGTCVVACQSENNIPIVGKDLVRRGREMHWMRIDRYFTADPKTRPHATDVYGKEEAQQFDEWIDNVQAVNQPMLCQHCEAAPCESVCPVNATVHDQEGLNVMVYNRCVGTRYCSNNCPYKVRRFNYLDYNKRPLDLLQGQGTKNHLLGYPSPLTHSTDGEWDMARWWKNPEAGMRPDDEWDLIRMLKNPDVTVRMRGVMEKCTYCVQRIEGAKIAQKVKAGASGDVLVPDGTIKTACEQACPAGAIVFGNIDDPKSRVSKLRKQERNYSVLEFLKTKPRTTYLARLRNPNPAMPDYVDAPWSFKEYEARGYGLTEHGEHGEGEAKHEAAGHGEKGAH